jgi:aspartyl-tRNA(Asn)/glutamyl-tRNA(Gln) amidotransferase subunit A
LLTNGLTYSSLREDLLSGRLRCLEVTERCLSSIAEHKSLNAFRSVLADRALQRAESVDRKIRRGDAGKLAGMIVAVKDNLAVRDAPATCGSRILDGYLSPYDATVVRRLESEDAICIGKTNLDEFGMGSTTENSAYGPVRNPFDPERIPGGSSGGSAAAVASGSVMTALGTDTGGSVRQPASHCGTVGLRPTYGRVSRFGLIAFASSLDTVGCLSNCVEDSCRMLSVIAGKDPLDSTSSSVRVEDYLADSNKDIRGLRVGLPAEYFGPGLDREVRDRIQESVRLMEKGGAVIRPVSLPRTEYGVATYYLVCTAEASSNLARYDGIRYGTRSDPGTGLDGLFRETRNRGFGNEVKRRIMLGTYVLSAGYYEAYYRKAQKVRTLVRTDFERAFESCDVVVGPTAPSTACKIGELTKDPLQMYLSDVYTVASALAGLPAVTVPVGKDRRGLPIGMQITGKFFAEAEILSVARWIERNGTPRLPFSDP